MTQYMPAIIMSVVTFLVCVMFLLPTLFKFGTDLVRFYWKGFWAFLSLIAFVAGGAEILRLSGMPVEKASIAALSGIMAAFIFFVVFAWFRLAGVALLTGFKSMKTSKKAPHPVFQSAPM